MHTLTFYQVDYYTPHIVKSTLRPLKHSRKVHTHGERVFLDTGGFRELQGMHYGVIVTTAAWCWIHCTPGHYPYVLMSQDLD